MFLDFLSTKQHPEQHTITPDHRVVTPKDNPKAILKPLHKITLLEKDPGSWHQITLQ